MKQKAKIKLENNSENENNSNLLEAKINSIISPNQDLSYNYLKNILLRLPDKDNANVICDYVLAMVQEFNISPLTRSNIINMLYRHIKYVNKKFSEITHEDINMYLQSLRNSQDEAQKWIGTYNLAIAILQKFYKWLYYPKISSEIRALPECVSGFKKIKRKELASYSPNDMWTMEEHATFLKYCPSVRMRAYHAMALDTSARPHELLKLKIKDLKERVIPSIMQRLP